MKRKIFRILSVFMAVALLAVLCVPAFAASGSAYEQKVGFWNWIAGKGSILNGIVGNTIGKVCSKSEDGYHHANSYQAAHEDGYFTCICSYCGKTFIAYESDLKQSYQQQVSTLPATGYNSDGSLLWSPTFRYMYGCYVTPSPWSRYYYSGCSHFELPSNAADNQSFVLIANCENLTAIVRPYSGLSQFNLADVRFRFEDSYPVEGYYSLLNAPSAQGYYIDSSGNRSDFNKVYSAGSAVFMEASKIYSYELVVCPDGVNYHYDPYSLFSVQAFVPVYRVTPFESIAPSINGQYNITTRPTTITGGNYGIVGDDGQIITINNPTKIINEGDNIYYNPATGQTYTITDWTYNYDNRIYNITLDTGDTVNVEYGDENITIVENNVVEGDTIVNNYTIYYMIDGSGSGDNPDPTPGPTACPHEWYKTGERQATCLIPAQRTYTCSICGEQKTETDPVLGHSWHAIQTVTTQYDESGNMTQEGYTIYECERCGEQYKSTNDTGPPPSGGGGSGGGSGDNIFSGIFGLIWDFFTFLFDLFSEFVVGGIKGFIDGLKDAGSSFFSILNPFNWDYGG